MQAALAFFARTPGHSLPKSRLAQQVGRAMAERLYFQSLTCCTQLAHQLTALGVDVSWAIAESEAIGDSYWQVTGLPVIHSGKGGLGECLARVHANLLERGDVGIVLGSDLPQLHLEDLEQTWQVKREQLPLVGPSPDGGFYLFASCQKLPDNVWTSVEYSTSTTLEQLELAAGSKLTHLALQPDFDDLASLAQVVEAMPSNPRPYQQKFIDLALKVLKSRSKREQIASC